MNLFSHRNARKSGPALAVSALVAVLAGCASPPPQPMPIVGMQPFFQLTSPSFPEGSALPTAYAGNMAGNANCVGNNVSPPLSWANPPAGTRSYALTVYDQEGRDGLGVVHFVAYGIPAATYGFVENELGVASSKYVGGKGTQGSTSYAGPCPPANTGQHHYVYTVIATDLDPMELPPGLTMQELLTRLQGHAKGGSSIVLRYGR